jgi:D-alanyl-D-alanine carboxypeptidase
MTARYRRVAAALLIGLIGITSGARASGARAGSAVVRPATVKVVAAPLPTCAYRDVLTARRAYSQYGTTLLDPTYRLPSTYYPRDLIPTGLRGGGMVRRVAVGDLLAMNRAARAAGARFAITSAFRSYGQQVALFNGRVARVGRAAALKFVARAGHSEHQLGTAIDFRSYDGRTPFATTRAGAWMRANAWKYGWVMSFPSGNADVTCLSSEPWHYRYVGRAIARSIHDSGLTTRQWIWTRFGS